MLINKIKNKFHSKIKVAVSLVEISIALLIIGI
jgi:hypothetical protein